MARKPAVAGMFYDSNAPALKRTVEECFTGRMGPGRLPEIRRERLGRVMGLVVPHAGYMYSGGAAAHAFAALAADGIPNTAVLLGPNHHGMGGAAAVSPDDEWETPLGTVSVDTEVRDAILRLSAYAQTDESAHLREHSLEVQLPFLIYMAGDAVKVVPIAIAHLGLEDAITLALDLGNAIAEALGVLRRSSGCDPSTSSGCLSTGSGCLSTSSGCLDAVVIASTDFTHYETKATAEAQDALAIARILDLDPEGLLRLVYERHITMCGVIGTAAMLQACKAMGANSARKLTYYTSGDVTGDADRVVGYAAISVGVA